MGVVGKNIKCQLRNPPEKHKWQKSGTVPCGDTVKQKYKCSKCAKTTIVDEVVETT